MSTDVVKQAKQAKRAVLVFKRQVEDKAVPKVTLPPPPCPATATTTVRLVPRIQSEMKNDGVIELSIALDKEETPGLIAKVDLEPSSEPEQVDSDSDSSGDVDSDDEVNDAPPEDERTWTCDKCNTLNRWSNMLCVHPKCRKRKPLEQDGAKQHKVQAGSYTPNNASNNHVL